MMDMPLAIGLCPTCKNVRVVKSARGSLFFMCRLSKIDERFSKYPSQPVMWCSGYEPVDAEALPDQRDPDPSR